MSFAVTFIAGTLDVIIPPCMTIQNGGLFQTKEQRYKLPANKAGVLALNFAGGIQIFEDMVPINTATQHPDYVYLEFVVTDATRVVSHEPLAGPFPQTMTLTSQTWASVSGEISDNMTVGGPTGGGNTWNGWNLPIKGTVILDITLSKAVAPGFYVRLLSMAAVGFRLMTDGTGTITCKVPLTVTGIGSTATALAIGRMGNGDTMWFVTVT